MSIYSRGGPPLRNEQGVNVSTVERSAELLRAPWHPTPLNPNAMKKDGDPYLVSSIETIDNIVEAADIYAAQHGIPEHVHSLVKPSLMAALLKRFENNDGKKLLAPNAEQARLLFAKAEIGGATPSELVRLLDIAPEIAAVELAKLSHPYEWTTSHKTDMDDAVLSAAIAGGFEGPAEQTSPRHYFARVDSVEEPKSLVVIRKMDMGTLSKTNNELRLVKRDSYIVDLQHPLLKHTHKEFMQWLAYVREDKEMKKRFGGSKLRYEGPELEHAVEAALQYEYHDGYLYPTVSSYYIHL